MSIQEYLPGIPKPYWQDFIKAIEPTKPKVIEAGSREVPLFEGIVDKRGILFSFSMNVNNPNLKFNLIVDDRKLFGTPAAINAAGYTGYYIKDFPWLSEYDTTNNIYVVNIITELPFQRDLYVTVTNTTTSPAVIGSMGFHAILFNKGFYKALYDLKNGKE